MTTASYLEFATQASQAEKERKWLQASELWARALECTAPKTPNYYWATARIKFCQHRHGAPTYSSSLSRKRAFTFFS